MRASEKDLPVPINSVRWQKEEKFGRNELLFRKSPWSVLIWLEQFVWKEKVIDFSYFCHLYEIKYKLWHSQAANTTQELCSRYLQISWSSKAMELSILWMDYHVL